MASSSRWWLDQLLQWASLHRAWSRLCMFAGAALLAALLVAIYGPLGEFARGPVGHMTDKEKADALNAARQTLLATLAGLAGAGGLAYTARTFHLARRGQRTDRYSKAIGQLASEKLEERLGGIYALEHLMRESGRDHQTVVEVLTAFVRERAPITVVAESPPNAADAEAPPQPASPTPTSPAPATDVQAALTVLGRRPRRREPHPMNLVGTALQGADLTEARLRQANLFGAQLHHAKLNRAQLQHANLNKAQLQGVHARRTQLQGARLAFAQLQNAVLCGAQMQESRLHFAQFDGASLGAALAGATLQTFGDPDGGAQLQGAHGLTADQLRVAVFDETTGLDPALRAELDCEEKSDGEDRASS